MKDIFMQYFLSWVEFASIIASILGAVVAAWSLATTRKKFYREFIERNEE